MAWRGSVWIWQCIELSRSLVKLSEGLKYLMRFSEIKMIKPIKPLNPEQARIAALKKSVEDAKRRLQLEKQKVIKPTKPTHLV